MVKTDQQSAAASLASSGTPGDILLDAGTNELEVLVFGLEGGSFGVNVAKVREVVRGQEPTQTPGSPSGVMGMLNMRGDLIPIVDLKSRLSLGAVPFNEIDTKRIIVTEFNGQRVGFLVDDVDQIRRVSWSSVRQAPELASLGRYPAQTLNSCTGIIEFDQTLVLMVDFESIADGVRFQDTLHVDSVDNPDNVDRASKRVLLAEDSPFMRETMGRVLRASGYNGLVIACDGAEAWGHINAPVAGDGQPFDAIVSDIEMPQVDGLHLTKRIKEDARLGDVPVVLFSSLVSKDNVKKGEQVGATVQIPKPDLPKLVRIVDLAVTQQLHRVDEIDAEFAAGEGEGPTSAAA